MTPTWGQLWLRACALVGWRVRAFGRSVVLRRLRWQRRRRPPNERVCISDVVAATGNPGQIIRVYGKERPLFTPQGGEVWFDVAKQAYSVGRFVLAKESANRLAQRQAQQQERHPNAETEFERNYLRYMATGSAVYGGRVRREVGLGVRSSWANRRPDNYHWRRSAMEE